ncbi:MAG: AAA family ATPase [Desulfobacteraceae bacterium]|nr:MAG: AAA family ATPase [Desulfobacteraceae bacterium]
MEEKDTDMSESDKLPNQKELEKELGEYLSKKYGDRVKIISPFLLPQEVQAQIDEERSGRQTGHEPLFEMLPEELEAYLDTFIIKQNQAKAVLATKICTHFNRVKHLKKQSGQKKTVGVGMIKNNILMIGPTGVGKTYMIKLIAQKIGVPFVKGDATKFSETGYVGGDVEDLVRDLLYEANEDVDLAEHGIIYIDEIDKIAAARNFFGHDVSRTGVQRALLKPMEETDVDLKVPHDAVSQIQAIENYRRTGKKEKQIVNTKNILFIMSGAFGELGEIIKKRLQKQGIGFEADVHTSEVPWETLKQVTARDLVEFGFESEFVGRLPVVVVFDELTGPDLVEILKNPNNPIILSKRQDFKAYGIDIKFEEEALRKIAYLAAKEKTGARGLVSAIERVIIPFEKRLPSTQIKRVLITPELVDAPERELAELLRNPDDPGRMERYERAVLKEYENIKSFIRQRAEELRQSSGLELYEERIELIAGIYLHAITDINSAFEDFKNLYQQIKMQEEPLSHKLDVHISFDESAIDALIKLAINKEQPAGSLAYDLAMRLEYGLILVKDRAGIVDFVITGEAITDMEKYVDHLIKQYYHQEPDGRPEETK